MRLMILLVIFSLGCTKKNVSDLKDIENSDNEVSASFEPTKVPEATLTELEIEPIVDTGCAAEVNCSCDAPGYTSRWKLSYCQYVIETDDCESARECMDFKVTKEIEKRISKMSDCEKNKVWKAESCKVFFKNAGIPIEKCEKNLPRLVEYGC